MAQSKSASGTKKNTSAKARAKKPIRREVGSVVCLALGLFTLIGYFVKDYWLIDGLCLYVFKGLFGWGFLVVPPCFLWAAVIPVLWIWQDAVPPSSPRTIRGSSLRRCRASAGMQGRIRV